MQGHLQSRPDMTCAHTHLLHVCGRLVDFTNHLRQLDPCIPLGLLLNLQGPEQRQGLGPGLLLLDSCRNVQAGQSVSKKLDKSFTWRMKSYTRDASCSMSTTPCAPYSPPGPRRGRTWTQQDMAAMQAL